MRTWGMVKRAGFRLAHVARHRRRVVVAAIGLVLAAVAVSAVVPPSRPAGPGYPQKPMPVLGAQFNPPSPLPTVEHAESPVPSMRPPLVNADPVWKVTLPDGIEPVAVARTSAGYVLQSDDDRLVGVDRDGKLLWSIHHDRWDDASVSRGVVLTSRDSSEDRWPQPKVITARDPATGKKLWQEREASFWTAYTGAVFMSVCYGGQSGQLGQCQLSARDPGSSAVRWSVPVHASTSVMGGGGLQARPVPAYLVVESFPTGRDSRTVSTRDPSTGARLGAAFEGFLGYADFPDVLVAIDDSDDNPADGCTAILTGYDLPSGRRLWRHIANVAKTPDRVHCQSLPDPDPGSPWLAATNRAGIPVVIQTRSGRVEWTGPHRGFGLAATTDVVLVLETGTTPGERQLVLYERASARPRWHAPVPAGASPDAASILARMVLTGWDGYGPVGYDLAAGDWWSYTGRSDESRIGYGPGWIAVCRPSTCTGYRIQ